MYIPQAWVVCEWNNNNSSNGTNSARFVSVRLRNVSWDIFFAAPRTARRQRRAPGVMAATLYALSLIMPLNSRRPPARVTQSTHITTRMRMCAQVRQQRRWHKYERHRKLGAYFEVCFVAQPNGRLLTRAPQLHLYTSHPRASCPQKGCATRAFMSFVVRTDQSVFMRVEGAETVMRASGWVKHAVIFLLCELSGISVFLMAPPETRMAFGFSRIVHSLGWSVCVWLCGEIGLTLSVCAHINKHTHKNFICSCS